MAILAMARMHLNSITTAQSSLPELFRVKILVTNEPRESGAFQPEIMAPDTANTVGQASHDIFFTIDPISGVLSPPSLIRDVSRINDNSFTSAADRSHNAGNVSTIAFTSTSHETRRASKPPMPPSMDGILLATRLSTAAASPMGEDLLPANNFEMESMELMSSDEITSEGLNISIADMSQSPSEAGSWVSERQEIHRGRFDA
ncbi:uncharacterized protein K489DRAFT_419156 [Dissoconium aciculare CBS 342.82]|uniref:Uncharacterized protein n=1 Tax=Dissoconium aciculare CBS 342.82 TaxID=1314786 RepID=A0A6J3MG50_9PEZI|nr:uncharacterized protein K489DRAFT_419156 [Dissoconium aciculare CBS 342.82]KAF1825867.1 hypothetical protein K489DRAFT_419156 [Dissoconium aciculare CBS 342.82]